MDAPRTLINGIVLGQPAGGVRRHNQELLPRLAELLRRRGGSLAILEGRTALGFELPDVIERIPSDVPAHPVRRRALGESRALRRALAAAAASGRPFDVVHSAHLPAPWKLGVLRTHTVHDLRSLDLPSESFMRRVTARPLLRHALAGASGVGVVSQVMMARVTQQWPQLEGRVTVIPNGADHLELRPRAVESPPFLLHVGHVEPRKGLETLVRALPRMEPALRLVLAGSSPGLELERLKSIACSLGVESRVEHIHRPDDHALASLYARARCAVFPSRLEGFGIGPAEALRAGCPVAASDIPAHRESTGGGAAYFAPGDVDALLAAVIAAEAAPISSPDCSSWDRSAEAWLEMLERAVAQQWPRRRR